MTVARAGHAAGPRHPEAAPHRDHVRQAQGLRRIALRHDRSARTAMSAIRLAAAMFFGQQVLTLAIAAMLQIAGGDS
ncbi:hypothetical protein [Teichococcus aestuarii]|uniref:hypothetical protein n=1 Tax=Teichococcus aestuarii TaxID=568898 RepID=UPI0036112E40